jgi:hypothetical protein
MILDDDNWSVPATATVLCISNAKRIVPTVDAEIRSAVARVEPEIRRAFDAEHGAGFYDWWTRFNTLAERFLVRRDYTAIRDLATHLLPNQERKEWWTLRLDKSTQRAIRDIKIAEHLDNDAVIRDVLEIVLLSWDEYPHKEPYRIGSTHEQLNGWSGFRVQIENAVKEHLEGRARLVTGTPYRDERPDDLATANDPNWQEKPQRFGKNGAPQIDTVTTRRGARRISELVLPPVVAGKGRTIRERPDPIAHRDIPQRKQTDHEKSDEANSSDDPRLETLLALPLKGLQARLRDLLIDNPAYTDAELSEITGKSAESIRKTRYAIRKKLT